MAAPDDEFLASLEKNFIGIGSSNNGYISNSTQYGLLIGEYKKYTVSGVSFSFKKVLLELQTVSIIKAMQHLFRSEFIPFTIQRQPLVTRIHSVVAALAVATKFIASRKTWGCEISCGR